MTRNVWEIQMFIFEQENEDAMMGSSYKMTDGVTLVFETDYKTENCGRVALIGSLPQLGEWEPNRCILAEKQHNSNRWGVRVRLPENTTFSWKWIIVSPDRENVYRWEECENRNCTTGRSAGRWEAMWNSQAQFYALVSSQKPNTELKEHGIVKEDGVVKEEAVLKEDGILNEDGKQTEDNTHEDDSEFAFQDSKPTFMARMRGRLCIII